MESTRTAAAGNGLAALLLILPTPVAAPASDPADIVSAHVASSTVVVNEFAPAGPGGSTDEFLELRNTTNQTVDLDRWELWACLSQGFPVLVATLAATDVITSGGRFVLAHENFTGPAPNLRYGGWNVPVDGGWLLNDPRTGQFDGVGLRQGAACTEGSPAPTCDWTAGEAATRDVQSTDTDNNAADFTCQSRTPGL